MPAGRSSAALRQKLYRQRQRSGEAVFRVKVPENVLLALLISGRLTAEDALIRANVEAELASVLSDWARQWRD